MKKILLILSLFSSLGYADVSINGGANYAGQVTASSMTDSGLSAGQCMQTGSGGLFSTSGSGCLASTSANTWTGKQTFTTLQVSSNTILKGTTIYQDGTIQSQNNFRFETTGPSGGSDSQFSVLQSTYLTLAASISGYPHITSYDNQTSAYDSPIGFASWIDDAINGLDNGLVAGYFNATNSANSTGAIALYANADSTGYALYAHQGNVNVQKLTASQFVQTDSSKNLISYDLFNATPVYHGQATWTSIQASTFTALNITGPGNQAAGAGQTGALNVTYQITAGSITINPSSLTTGNVLTITGGNEFVNAGGIHVQGGVGADAGSTLEAINTNSSAASHYGVYGQATGINAGGTNYGASFLASGGGTNVALDTTGGGLTNLSSTTLTGYIQLKSLTHAAIQALTPGSSFQEYGCSDCSTVPVCISTGTALGAWSLITNKTSACL